MQRRIIRTAHLIGAAVVCISTANAQAATGTCLPKTDTTSTKMVHFFNSLLTPSNPAEDSLRTSIGMASVTSAQIVPVTNDKVCAQAAGAMNTIATTKRRAIALYVVTLGGSFAVVDTTTRINGYTPVWVFDGAWNFVELLKSF